MVLCRDNLFEGIAERFTNDRELDLLLIAVHDIFTDTMLIGMNIFRNTVRWNKNQNDLITDRIYIPETIRKKVKDYDDLAPAAIHCPNPSPYQAFHFGFHRGMKAKKGGGNWGIVQALFKHYRRNPDTHLAYAMLGLNAAFTNRFSIDHISYNDDTLFDYFKDRYISENTEFLHRSVKRSRVFWLFTMNIDKRILFKLRILR
jgi:hypothetical protein